MRSWCSQVAGSSIASPPHSSSFNSRHRATVRGSAAHALGQQLVGAQGVEPAARQTSAVGRVAEPLRQPVGRLAAQRFVVGKNAGSSMVRGVSRSSGGTLRTRPR